MVLMTVGNNNSPDLILILYNISKIGNYDINARKILIGERHAAIYQKHIVAILIKCDILTDFVETA